MSVWYDGWAPRLICLVGITVFILMAWAVSSDRRRFPWRIVLGGLLLQLLLAFLVLRTSGGRWVFDQIGDLFTAVMSNVEAGSGFLFATGNRTPIGDSLLATFAFGVLPTVVFFSSLMSVLYHLGVMQRLVAGMAWVMRFTLGTSGPETLAAAANVFVGHTEAPLVVRPYLSSMSRSELMAMMTGGFATVTGGLLGAYAGMGIDIAHLLTASVISAPAALLIAKVMVPESPSEKNVPESPSEKIVPELPSEKNVSAGTRATGEQGVTHVDEPETDQLPDTSSPASLTTETTPPPVAKTLPRPDSPPVLDRQVNVIAAAVEGAGEGLKLALNVAAMLIAFLALLALVDSGLAALCRVGGWVDQGGTPALSMGVLLGYVGWPLAWLLGIPPDECAVAGRLIGLKTVANEFVAFQALGELRRDTPAALSERSAAVLTYALAGFSNFAAIGIQVGGIGGLAPDRKRDLAELGLRAMFGGLLACCITGAVAGVML